MSVDETPREAAPKKPTVLDVTVVGDRTLVTVEQGDVSLVLEAPTGISAEELEQTLAGIPKSIERTTERFAMTKTMSDDTTEIDDGSDFDDKADGFGGGA